MSEHSRAMRRRAELARTVGGHEASAAMAEYAVQKIRGNLNARSHPPETKTPAPPGGPPARISGRLLRSVTAGRTTGRGGVWVTEAGSRGVIYAHVQEYGREIHARRAPFLVFVQDGMVHRGRQVYIPPRPFVTSTVAQIRHDGSLTRAGEAAFHRAVLANG